MKVPTKPLVYLFAVAAAALLSSCGSSGVTANATTAGQLDTGTGTPTITPTSPGYGAYTFSYQTVGGSAPVASAPLVTDSTLKVQVFVDPATHNLNTPVYTNFTANYTCATISVTLQVSQNGTYVTYTPVTTGRIYSSDGTGAGCPGSAASQTIDFSSYMLPGHGDVKITAQAVTSNFNCTESQILPYNYPYGYYQMNCASNPMQSVYQYNVVNGHVEVQADGTSFN